VGEESSSSSFADPPASSGSAAGAGGDARAEATQDGSDEVAEEEEDEDEAAAYELEKARLELIVTGREWALQDSMEGPHKKFDAYEADFELLEDLEEARMELEEFCSSRPPRTVNDLLAQYVEVWVVEAHEEGFEGVARFLGLEEEVEEGAIDRLHCAQDVEGQWRWLECAWGRRSLARPKVARRRMVLSISELKDEGLHVNELSLSVEIAEFSECEDWASVLGVLAECTSKLEELKADGWEVATQEEAAEILGAAEYAESMMSGAPLVLHKAVPPLRKYGSPVPFAAVDSSAFPRNDDQTSGPPTTTPADVQAELREDGYLVEGECVSSIEGDVFKCGSEHEKDDNERAQ